MDIKEEKNTFLDISNWWGHKKPGVNGIVIKQDGVVIEYMITSKIEEGKLVNNKTEKEICKLSEKELKNIKKVLIEDEKVFETKYEQPMIFDMGTTVKINIDGNEIIIKNESKIGNESEEKLYDRLLNLINNLMTNKNR